MAAGYTRIGNGDDFAPSDTLWNGQPATPSYPVPDDKAIWKFARKDGRPQVPPDAAVDVTSPRWQNYSARGGGQDAGRTEARMRNGQLGLAPSFRYHAVDTGAACPHELPRIFGRRTPLGTRIPAEGRPRLAR
jgi:hypothetical protein